MGTTPDEPDVTDDALEGAVVSVLTGTSDTLTVKQLRKLVLLALQLDEDDRAAKKRYKRAVQALEAAGRLRLDATGAVSLRQSKADRGTAKHSKKSKRRKLDADGDRDAGDSHSHDDDGGGGADSGAHQTTKDRDTPTKSRKEQPCPGNPQGVTRLFLGNLPFAVDESSLGDFLPGVTHIKWITDKETGKFYGSAFVEMDTAQSAADAVAKSGEPLLGRPIKVNYAPARDGDVWPPPKKVISGGNQGTTTGGQAGGKGIQALSARPENCTKLFIGNLSYDIDDDGITKFFASVDAEVKTVRWLHHKDSGDFKGVGFVEFWNEEACERAASLNGKDLLGRPIRIDWDSKN